MRQIVASAIQAVAICAVVLAVGLSPAVAQHAPPATPSRIDNIWGWRAHQPTEAEVRSRKPADAATAQAQRSADDEVNQIYQSLMGRSAG